MITSIIVLAVLVVIQARFLFKFAKTILEFEENIEFALDEIDLCYAVVNEILEKPLFNDSPEVKQMHDQLKKIGDTILSVAGKISTIEEDYSPEV